MALNPFRTLLFHLALLGTLQGARAHDALPRLNDAPRPGNPASTPLLFTLHQAFNTGENIDGASRASVRGAYLAAHLPYQDLLMNSSAVTAECIPGTNSQAFRDAVQHRINWFRAMAGVPAEIQLDAGYNAKCQHAALMMSANYELSHSPPSSWSCYSSDGAQAAANSNLVLGKAGPDAIDTFIQDFGAENAGVGHRRWLLYPQTQQMGTGDIPLQGETQAANATWVSDSHGADPRPPTRTPYVAWPPPGYVPAPVVFPRWSLSYPNAAFGAATVSMLSNGIPIPVVLEPVETDYAENTLVWIPMGLNAYNQATLFPFDGVDAHYEVNVTGAVVGGIQTNWTYTVIVFDPLVAGPDESPPVITLHDPVVGDNSVTLDFTVLSGLAFGPFELWMANAFTDEWIHDTNALLTTLDPGVSYRLTSPSTQARQFYRVKAW